MMMARLYPGTVIIALLSFFSKAFVPTLKYSPRHLKLYAIEDDALARNQARTDARNFLTQRAIQSFMFLLKSCRDPHTVQWMENTYQLKNLDSYHGTGALNFTVWSEWDMLLRDMVQQPSDVVIVSARRRGRGHGGWSSNNPHMEDRFVEFEIDIEPVSLVSRILSVREQLANEWVADLETLRATNEAILKSYHGNQMATRDEECIVSQDESDEDMKTSGDECMSLESLYAKQGRKAFDRTGIFLLENAIVREEGSCSPFRKSNFDLLCLLSTQESVHRMLREYQQSGDRRESFEWLREFYVDRVDTHFDGAQPYGRSEDFLEELLLSNPSMKQEAGSVSIVDPLRIAEELIQTRSLVALDWKEYMRSVPQDHMDIRRDVLAKRMNAASSPLSSQIETLESSMEGGFE